MDIIKAKKLVELTRENKKILITLYEGGQISSCVEEEAKRYCETCQGDDDLCRDFVEHLKSQGYEATEIELGDLELEESLPKFLERREEQVATPEDVGKVEELLGEPEGDKHAVSETLENLPRSDQPPPEGE